MTLPRCALTVALAAAAALSTAPLAVAPLLAAPLRQPHPVAPAAADLLPLVLAQSCEGNCEPEPEPEPERPRYSSDREGSGGRDYAPASAVTPGGKVARFIAARVRECQRYAEIWRIDCLSDTLQQAAAVLPATPEYSAARKDIAAAAGQLQRIADRYADPKKAKEIRVARSGRRTARAIVAVRPDALPVANAAAAAIVNDLSTTLLRSASDGSTAAQITAVAASVDSSLVLLRSS